MSEQHQGFQHFHFTLGPVQGFVAQARRTRDFWAGSFILSWLSAVAAKAVLHQDSENEIVFPEVDRDFLGWLQGKPSGPKPTQGNIPNRFMALVKGDSFDPDRVVESVRTAWQALAAKVWEHDLAHIADAKVQDVWKRQIEGIGDAESFWEMAWALTGPGDDESAILDRRKNWRSHFPPHEPGVKCMMMDGWQELSGAESPTKPEGDRLDAFWKRVRDQGRRGMKTDLRAKEHLCAIAFVKRRFVRCFEDVAIEMPGGWTLKGWALKPGTPSTPFMAAVHWLEETLKRAQADQSVQALYEQFRRAAHALCEDYGEWDSHIRCLEGTGVPHRWTALDGDVFFETALDNPNIFGDRDDPQRNQAQRTQAEVVKKRLRALRAALGTAPPTPFYAVLMMDGDSLGALLSDTDRQAVIKHALATFTGAVKRVVEERNGFLIYAGGDDVLAVLPLEDAMDCALALRRRYMAGFAAEIDAATAAGKLPTDKRFQATLSGAIEYAHIRMPLTKVLKDAHGLLDGVAKEGRGRDALAVRVWKPGGKAIEWAMPWEIALEDDPAQELASRRLAIQVAAGEFEEDDTDGQYSSRFFYRIRERFELLNPTDDKTEPVFPPGGDEALDLIAAEYLSSGLCDQLPAAQRMEHAKSVVRPLLRQCRPVTRDAGVSDPSRWKRHKQIQADGALLVRFLAQKGVER